MNYMMWCKGDKADYDSWSSQGCDGWSFEDCQPYFMKSETVCADVASPARGSKGPMTITMPKVRNDLTEPFVQVSAGVMKRYGILVLGVTKLLVLSNCDNSSLHEKDCRCRVTRVHRPTVEWSTCMYTA